MTQPEALRLADELDGFHTAPHHKLAATELRRLHAENERLQQINQSHEMKLSVRGYELQIDDLKAVNRELLEALKNIKTDTDGRFSSHIGQDRAYAIARAAIAKAEGDRYDLALSPIPAPSSGKAAACAAKEV
jgi:hypothetical protein